MKAISFIKNNALAMSIALTAVIGFSAFKAAEVKNDSPFYPMENGQYQSTPLNPAEEDVTWSCEPGEICSAQFSTPPSPTNQTPDGEIKSGKLVRH